MSWEWSHTHDAYLNVRRNIETLPNEELCVILAECETAVKTLAAMRAEHEKQEEHARNTELDYVETPFSDPCGAQFDPAIYARELQHAQEFLAKCGRMDIADAIYDHACEIATCDNGGFYAWLCPYGCHTVSFDRKGTMRDRKGRFIADTF